MSEARAVPLRELIVVPAVITLAVTILRLTGELQGWSKALFNPEAGGGGAIVGIAWLVPVFGIYFALKLVRLGFGPGSPWGVVGLALLATALLIGVGFGLNALKPGFQGQILGFGAASLAAVALVYRPWPELGRTLVAYAVTARVPVALVMLIAIFGNWGTHYDVMPPGVAEIPSPVVKWFWIGLVPQFTIWIFFTAAIGALFGGVTAAITGRRK